MKRWFVWMLLGMIQPCAFSQAPAFSIQCPGVVSIYRAAADTVTAVVPTDLTPAGGQYQWSVQDPTGGPTSLVTLTGTQGKSTMTFRPSAPGHFLLTCVYGSTPPASKSIEILPDPNLKIVSFKAVTRGSTRNTATISQSNLGGDPGVRYEWLSVPGVKIVGSANTSTLIFDIDAVFIFRNRTQLIAKVTNRAGKSFLTNLYDPINNQTASTNGLLDIYDPPNSTITLRSSVVTLGDARLYASVPVQNIGTYGPVQYHWTISSGGLITSGQGSHAINFTAISLGNLVLTCNVIYPLVGGGVSSLSSPAVVKVVPMPQADIDTSSTPAELGVAYTARVVPQSGVTYCWKVWAGLGVVIGGQGSPTMTYMVTGPSGTNAPIAVDVTNEAGKTVSGVRSRYVSQIDTSVSFGTNRPLVHNRSYTVTTTAWAITPPPTYAWKIKKIRSGVEFEEKFETANPFLEIGADGDVYSKLSVSCAVGNSVRSGSAIIIPSADANIVAPSKVTIGIPFQFSNPTGAIQNYITNWELLTIDGKKLVTSSLTGEQATFTVFSGLPGMMTLTAKSTTSSGVGFPGTGDDTQTTTIELLAKPVVSGLTVNQGYGRSTNHLDSWGISRGAVTKVTPVFSGGDGVISEIGPVLSGETYDTPAIFNETTLELVVTNAAGATAKKSITLIPTAPDLEIRFITINQGVERYLNLQDQIDGTYNNSTFPQGFWQAQTWKKDVPLIAGRPARFTVHVLSQGGTSIPFGTGATAKNTLSLVLTNNGVETVIPMKTATFSPPTVGTSFGETDGTKLAQFDVMEPTYPLTLLNEQTMVSIRVTLDPALGIDPLKGVDNPYRDPVPLGLKYMPRMEVHLVSIDYTYRNNGNLRTVGMTNAELDAFAVRIGLLNSIKALFPISHVDALGAPLVTVQANPLGITAGWNEEFPGAIKPGVPRGPFYVINQNDYDANTGLMRAELLQPPPAPPADPTMAEYRPEYLQVMGPNYGDQNNVYVLGVIRRISGRTYPATTGTNYTEGLGDRGTHWAWALADVNESGTIVPGNHAATTAPHELGHANGAAHAPHNVWKGLDPIWETTQSITIPLCMAPAYGFGGIGVIGFSSGTLPWRPLAVLPTDKDLMSYSQDSIRWISDYNFSVFYRQQKNIRDYVVEVISYGVNP